MSTSNSFNIYLARHEKVSGPSALYGVTDISVSDKLQQNLASQLSHNLSFEQLYTSPLRRCALCATLVSQQTNVPVTLVEEIRELNFGTFDGVAFDSINPTDWSILEKFWLNPVKHSLPSAESITDFRSRVLKAFRKIVSQIQSDTLLICHGGVIRILIADVLGLDISNSKLYSNLSIKNGSVTQFKVTKFEEFDTPHISIEYIGRQLK